MKNLKLKHYGALMASMSLITMLAAGCGGREGGVSSAAPASQPSTASSTAPTEAPLNAYTLYTDAVAKMLAAKSYDAAATNVVKQEGMDMTSTQRSNVHLVMLEEDGIMQSLSDVTVSVLGQTVTASEYYDGSYAFYAANGAKLKQKCSKERYLTQKKVLSSREFLSFDEKAMRDAAADEKGDTVIISATVAADTVKAQLADLMGGLDETLSSLGEMSFADPQLKMTIDKDGYIKEYTLVIDTSIPLDTTGDGTTAGEYKVSLEMSIVFNKLDNGVSITPPDGLDAYQELPESPLTIEEILQITSSLFDEQGNPVAEFDEIYAYYQQAYGAEVIDNLFKS